MVGQSSESAAGAGSAAVAGRGRRNHPWSRRPRRLARRARRIERNATELAIATAGASRVFDADFKSESVAHGKGSSVASLASGNGAGYVMRFGTPGQTLTVSPR